MSNQGIDLDVLAPHWVRFILADRDRIFVNLDWTDFDADGHTMLVASVQTQHGRSTPLLWKTHDKATLKGNRARYEDDLLRRLRELIPRTVHVVIVADRGFADQALFAYLSEELGFGYVIRIKASTLLTDAKGEQKVAGERAGPLCTYTNHFDDIKGRWMRIPWGEALFQKRGVLTRPGPDG